MTRPLSMDIRERAMARLDAGETVRAIAEALSVAPSSVVKWSERRRETGSVAPGKIGGKQARANDDRRERDPRQQVMEMPALARCSDADDDGGMEQ